MRRWVGKNMLPRMHAARSALCFLRSRAFRAWHVLGVTTPARPHTHLPTHPPTRLSMSTCTTAGVRGHAGDRRGSLFEPQVQLRFMGPRAGPASCLGAARLLAKRCLSREVPTEVFACGGSRLVPHPAEIWLNSIRYAMIDQLRRPRPGFEAATRAHFRLLRWRIMKQCGTWLEQARALDPLFQVRKQQEGGSLMAGSSAGSCTGIDRRRMHSGAGALGCPPAASITANVSPRRSACETRWWSCTACWPRCDSTPA